MKYGESAFDILYLLTALTAGIWLLRRRNNRAVWLMGWAVLILGAGDAFHLVPRVLNYFLSGDFTAALGIGKLVTSVTMTVFYLLLYLLWLRVYGEKEDRRMTAAMTVRGSTPSTDGMSASAKLPSCQYVMAASSVSGSAIYLMKPSIELMAPETIIPESTSIIFELLLTAFGMRRVSVTAAMPPAKASTCSRAPPRESKMPTAAPIHAPDETPRNSGLTRGFLNIP